MKDGNGERYLINSIVQAVTVLDAIADNRAPMSMKEIIKATGLSQNTVFRVLITLEHTKMVQKVGDHYKLGMGAVNLWARFRARLKTERDAIDKLLRKTEVEEDGA